MDDLSLVDNNFKKATDAAQEIFQHYIGTQDKTSVFCEYVSKPKQNTIAYQRIPKNYLVVFDVKIGTKYLNRKQKEEWVDLFPDLEIVPLLWEGKGEDFNETIQKELLTTPSFLGHQKGYDRIEGIVVKNYDQWYDVDKYPYLEGHWLCTKIVNESFKEKSKIENPGAGQKLQDLKDSLRSEARWRKGVQHLNEKGLLINEMQDMRFLVKEIKDDIQDEEIQFIKDELFSLYGRDILDYATKGLAEWYKNLLMENTKNGNQQTSQV